MPITERRSSDGAAAPDVDGVTVVTIGTVLWGVAGLALLLFRDRLVAAGNGWWLWTCLVGFLLGAVGIAFVRVRRSRLSR